MGDTIKSYVTRGAVLVCSCGSHSRCINQIYDHGWGIDVKGMKDETKKTHPFILSSDNIVGDEGMDKQTQQNISWFGVCTGNVTGTDSITLKPDERLGNTKNAVGKKCKPLIIGDWQNCKSKFCVKSKQGEGAPITSESYLVCGHGGHIKVLKGEKGNQYGVTYDGKLDE